MSRIGQYRNQLDNIGSTFTIISITMNVVCIESLYFINQGHWKETGGKGVCPEIGMVV